MKKKAYVSLRLGYKITHEKQTHNVCMPTPEFVFTALVKFSITISQMK